MAARKKTTVAIGAGATSGYMYMGESKPVYTIYTTGTYTGSIQVFSSPNAFSGNVLNTGTIDDIPEFGELPTGETAALNALTSGAVATIRHPVAALIFKSSAGVTVNPATIYVVTEA